MASITDRKQIKKIAPIKVLVVDDSAFMRMAISQGLSDVPGLELVGTAGNGKEAIKFIDRLKPDVVTLDIEMPVMDGLTALRKIMEDSPLPVVMLSSLTQEGTKETINALTLGAVDFISKPSAKANMTKIMDELVVKIVKASQASVKRIRKGVFLPEIDSRDKKSRHIRKKDKVLVIGASTGGPRALASVIAKIPEDINAAILIVQHMPVGFTAQLAKRFNKLTPLNVKEASDGDKLEVGTMLLAPGGKHMILSDMDTISLNENPSLHGVRPAVDLTLVSVVEKYRDRTVGVILTGMGRDGSNGAALVHEAGGWMIAEAEETCVVFGMPRSVIEIGAANEITLLGDVPDALIAAVKRDLK